MGYVLQLILAVLLSASAWAQLIPGNFVEIQDEGTIQGRVRALNCTGAGVACSVSGITATVDVSSGGGGAPTGYAYWGNGSDATLSAEINLAALSTGLVLNTSGTPSTYPGVTCTGQVLRVLSSSGGGTCQTITSAYVDSSIALSARQILTSSPLTGGGDLTADRTISFASQLTNLVLASPNGSSGVPTFRALVDADVPNTITVDLATAATALAANGGNCSGNNFALGVDASGVGECAQPAFSNLSGSATDAQIPNTITLDNLTQITTRQFSDTTGTVGVGRGGTGQTTITTNQVYVGTALDTLAAKTLPSCSNATTSKLLYDNATQTFSCGTDQSGGAGASWTQYEIDFGASAKFVDTEIVTDAAVSGTSKIIVMQYGVAATGRQADENEMDGIQCNAIPGTGQFTLNCRTERTPTHGKFKVLYNVS